MSWVGGYKSKEATLAEQREARRKKLEADHQERLKRARQRADRQKQLQKAEEAREEANQAIKSLLEIAPDILEGEPTHIDESASDILDDTAESAIMPDNAGPPVQINFEDENENDDADAMREAFRNLARFNWDENDLLFTFNQIEVKMATVGVKKNWTKFQVLTTILPKNIQEQVKPLLRKQSTEFPNNDAYKQLKTRIMRIFGPRPEAAMDRALTRVLTSTPSNLARELLNDICKHELDCDCCPAVILSLWKRQLPGVVRAGIASSRLTKDTFETICQLADDIFMANRPSSSVSAVSLDETQPAIPYATQPEVAAVSRGRGRGRGRGRNRGGRGGQGGGGQAGQNQTQTPAQRPVTRHPDNAPPGSCSMHVKWGKSAHFCVEPSSCPWKNFFTPKPAK